MSKSKSFRYDCFIIEPTHVRLWVACLPDFGAYEAAKHEIYKANDREKIPNDPKIPFEMGALYQADPEQNTYILYCLKEMAARSIVHEAFHVVNSLGYLHYLDPPSEACDEAYAYLMESVTVKIADTLRKLGGTITPL